VSAAVHAELLCARLSHTQPGQEGMGAWAFWCIRPSDTAEDLCFVVGVGVLQDRRDLSELVHDRLYLCLGHAVTWCGLAAAEFVASALGFGLGHPRGNRGWVCPGV